VTTGPGRLEPPAYPGIVRGDEERERFARLYDDLVRVIGMAPADALLHATEQFTLGFDVRGPFEKRKRRKRVALGADEGPASPDREPPG
jgi:hypothetical protein